MNAQRAEWANAALRRFQEATRTDDEDSLADLLGDLMHRCDYEHVNFEHELRRTRGMYHFETTGEPEDEDLVHPPTPPDNDPPF